VFLAESGLQDHLSCGREVEHQALGQDLFLSALGAIKERPKRVEKEVKPVFEDLLAYVDLQLSLQVDHRSAVKGLPLG